MRFIGVIVALVLALTAVAADKPDELTPERRQEMEKKASALGEKGMGEYQRADYVKAKETFRQVLEIRRALYPKEQIYKGHPNLVTSISNLAFLHLIVGDFGKAEPLFREALDMDRAIFPKEQYPKGHPLLALRVDNLASLHKEAG